ncbi:MAG: hypothetical protein K2K21_09590 [Lachnospiraceae bacterium]|nr:hypothetical protein [Lachnospiraceae bacterium]
MKEKNESKNIKAKKRIWILALALLLFSQIITMIYFGSKKAGFHEDEYYSYYSTNRTAGLFEPDREWMDKDTIRNEFVVLQGERFRYGQVATVQSWDVHPPFFYFLLHTVCSFFPGVFSKWLGISVNMIAFCLNFALLSWLAYMVTRRNRGLTLVVAVVHGFNPIIISGVMFIRMYEWLTVFILSCACLHARAVLKMETDKNAERKIEWKSFLLPLMLINYLGFLTQYYYMIFLFFIAVGFCLWNFLPCVGKKENGRGIIIHKESLKRCVLSCVKYGCACGISLLLAIISYPASLSHIFRGYRGTGAVSEFLDTTNTDERLSFFARLMNEYLFDGFLWLWIIALAVMGGAVYWKLRRIRKMRAASSRTAYFLLLFAVCGYFFTVSKTALLLYETSNRYQLPVYGIVTLLVITALYGLWKELIVLFDLEKGRNGSRLAAAGGVVLCFLMLAGDVHGILSDKVIFLYEEDRENVAYARENAHMPVIILYNDVAPYNVWWCSQELMEYDRIYFASEGNNERITDEVLCNSGKIIVYAADCDTKEESLQMILESDENLGDYRLISQKSLWSVYEFE